MYSCIVSQWNWWDYSSSYLCSQLNFLWLPPQGPIQEVCWSGAWTSQADSFQINSIEQKFYYNLLTEVWATYPVRKTHFSLLYELYQPFHGTKLVKCIYMNKNLIHCFPWPGLIHSSPNSKVWQLVELHAQLSGISLP